MFNLCVPAGVVCSMNLLQEVTLEVDEVVGLDDVGAALTAEHSGEQGLHSWRALPRAHHGIGYLRGLHAHTRREECSHTLLNYFSSLLFKLSAVGCLSSAGITVK